MRRDSKRRGLTRQHATPRSVVLRRVSMSLVIAMLLGSATLAEPGDPTAERQADLARAEQLAREAEKLFVADDLLGSLRARQRALFWLRQPNKPAIAWPNAERPAWVDEMVPIAISLGRLDEAVRYTLLLPKPAVDDPQTLRRLALHAREQRQWADSIRLQERWLASRGGGLSWFETLLTKLEIGRLHVFLNNAEEASRAFEPVQQALAGGSTRRGTRTRIATAVGGSLASTWLLFGETHRNADRPRLAAQAFNQLAATPDGAARAAYGLARLALDAGRPLDAHDLLQQHLATAEQPDPAFGRGPYTLLRQVYRRLNHSQEAIDELRAFTDTNPNNLTAALELGKALHAADQTDEAEKVIARTARRAIDAGQADPLLTGLLDDDAPEPDYRTIAAAGVWLLERYAATRQQEAFASLAHDLHVVFDGLDEFQEQLAATLTKHADFANDLLDRLANEEGLAAFVLADLQLATGRYSAASKSFRTAILREQDKDRRRLIALAWWRAMMLDEQYADAADALRWAIGQSLWPADTGEPHYHLAAALALADDTKSAVQAARHAAERAPGSLDYAERVGWALTQADRPAEAITAYTAIVKQHDGADGADTRELLRRLRMSLSYLTDQQGDTTAAARWALEALDEFPEDASALNDLSYQWSKRGEHPRRAVAMAHRAVELAPDNFAYWDSLGWAQFQLGEHRAALEALDQAIRLAEEQGEPADAEILDHQGDVLASLEQTNKAHTAWQQSAEAYDAADDAEAAARVRAKLPANEERQAVDR